MFIKNPVFAPMVMLNDKLFIERTKFLINDIHKKGIKSIMPIPLPDIGYEYLSDEYFQQYEIIIKECKKRSMDVWIWDDPNYDYKIYFESSARKNYAYSWRGTEAWWR